METKENNFEFGMDYKVFKKLIEEKNYKLPALPLAIIKATAPVQQKRRFKKYFFNTAGIYGWINLESSFCYVGSSVKLHIRPWQHLALSKASTNKNLKLLLKKNIENFVLVIFETIGSSDQVSASLLEVKENLYLQQYIPQELLLNVLPFAYTNFGYKHTEETKKTFSLMRKGKKGKKRPDITGPLNPMYGLIKEQNPFFGKKHTKQNVQKISMAATVKTGLKNSQACPVKVQSVDSMEFFVFQTKTEAAKFLNVVKANTVTQYIKKKKVFQKKWLLFSITKEEYFIYLQK